MSEKAKDKIALYERECAPCLKKLEHYLKGGCRNCSINQMFIEIENRKEVDYKQLWENRNEHLLERDITISELEQQIEGLQTFERLWETLKVRMCSEDEDGDYNDVFEIMETMKHEQEHN